MTEMTSPMTKICQMQMTKACQMQMTKICQMKLKTIFFSKWEQDFEFNNNDHDDDFFKELPKLFEDDEKIGDKTTKIFQKWLNPSQRKKHTLKQSSKN